MGGEGYSFWLGHVESHRVNNVVNLIYIVYVLILVFGVWQETNSRAWYLG